MLYSKVHGKGKKSSISWGRENGVLDEERRFWHSTLKDAKYWSAAIHPKACLDIMHFKIK